MMGAINSGSHTKGLPASIGHKMWILDPDLNGNQMITKCLVVSLINICLPIAFSIKTITYQLLEAVLYRTYQMETNSSVLSFINFEILTCSILIKCFHLFLPILYQL